MTIITKILLIVLSVLTMYAPVYMKVKADFTNWEWGLTRVRMYQAIIGMIFSNDEIIVRPTRLSHWRYKDGTKI